MRKGTSLGEIFFFFWITRMKEEKSIQELKKKENKLKKNYNNKFCLVAYLS